MVKTHSWILLSYGYGSSSLLLLPYGFDLNPAPYSHGLSGLSLLSIGFGLILVLVIFTIMDLVYGSPNLGSDSIYGYLESPMGPSFYEP